MTLAPKDMLCFALYSTSHAMQQSYRPLLEELGLTYPQYLVMAALWREDGVTMGALGRDVKLTSNTLTPLVKRLEARGLITRSRGTADERQVRIDLTEAGRALQSPAETVGARFLECTGLTYEEATALHGTLVSLQDRLRAAAEG
ncbi:MarR family winged helix-turn-helix transcriptional regulator [Tropicibacter sp. S64]|uniref:MarR family winged helix-turn-helix transcriptional regulator n=1 Tax=Tropicibacter sp. S64 TaxID=3415122 RepID=UPI003C7EA377